MGCLSLKSTAELRRPNTPGPCLLHLQLGKLKGSTEVRTLRPQSGGQWQERYLDHMKPRPRPRPSLLARHLREVFYCNTTMLCTRRSQRTSLSTSTHTKKSPNISKLFSRAPSAAVRWGSSTAQGLVAGVGGQVKLSRMRVLGISSGWGGQGTSVRHGQEHGEGLLLDLQTLELIGCCLQLGFIAQLLINCFRI